VYGGAIPDTCTAAARRKVMKRLIVSALLVVFALCVWQPRAFTQNGAAPTVN